MEVPSENLERRKSATQTPLEVPVSETVGPLILRIPYGLLLTDVSLE